MKLSQCHTQRVPEARELAALDRDADLVLVFGAPAHFAAAAASGGFLPQLREHCPHAILAGCSTAGEIGGGAGVPHRISDGGLVLTAIHFDQVHIHAATTHLAGMGDSTTAGERLARQLPPEPPGALLLFAQGVNINGSALIAGLRGVLGDAVPISGGLAGDGTAFQQTWVLGPQGCTDDNLVAIALYGPALRFHHGSYGGWEPFGPLRRVTRSAGNLLYELDGRPALTLYREYLGDYARDLPASGLLFPFEMFGQDRDTTGVIRTILGVDEENQSLVLAGDILQGGYVQLMHASTDQLVAGAENAAHASGEPEGGPALGLLVSCVGRKLVMGDRVEEEVEAVAEVFGRQATLTGFYSYGEISTTAELGCRLHNQTMTVTWIGEAP